jgi:NADH-quinone oxidoreductase subunit E
MLNGADDLIDYLEKKLGVKTGQVTKNGLLNVKIEQGGGRRSFL